MRTAGTVRPAAGAVTTDGVWFPAGGVEGGRVRRGLCRPSVLTVVAWPRTTGAQSRASGTRLGKHGRIPTGTTVRVSGMRHYTDRTLFLFDRRTHLWESDLDYRNGWTSEDRRGPSNAVGTWGILATEHLFSPSNSSMVRESQLLMHDAADLASHNPLLD